MIPQSFILMIIDLVVRVLELQSLKNFLQMLV